MLADDDLGVEAGGGQGDGEGHAEFGKELHIHLRKITAPTIEKLQDGHHGPVAVTHGHCQQRSGSVARDAIYGRVEVRIGVGIIEDQGFARGSNCTDDALSDLEPKTTRGNPLSHHGRKATAVRIDQEETAALGIDQSCGDIDDVLCQFPKIKGRVDHHSRLDDSLQTADAVTAPGKLVFDLGISHEEMIVSHLGCRGVR